MTSFAVNLAIDAVGEAVERLHVGLALLGHAVAIDEVAKQTFGVSTELAVKAFQLKMRLKVTGVVDEETADCLGRDVHKTAAPPAAAAGLSVSGTVRSDDGDRLAGVAVRAFDKDLRHEHALGSATSDGNGRYAIAYSCAEPGGADLVVRAYAADGRTAIAESPVLFHAPAKATVDLTIAAADRPGPSELERVEAATSPALDGAQPFELTADDAAFLAGETGLAAALISTWANAARLAQQTELPTALFYGLLRAGLPSDLGALLAVAADQRRAALQRSLDARLVPASLAKNADELLAALQKLAASYPFQPQPGAASLADLLAGGGVGASVQQKFVALYFAHAGPIEAFWTDARKQLGDPAVDDLLFSLQAATLARGYLPLTAALQQMRKSQKVPTISDLALLDQEAWRKLLDAQQIGAPADAPGATDGERADNYALTLARTLEQAFPTRAVALRLARDPSFGNSDLARFFANSPDFEFETHQVAAYLAAHATATDGVADVPVVNTGQPRGVFRDGQGAVVEGVLGRDGVFRSDLVLVKHSNSYEPPAHGTGRPVQDTG